MELEEEQNYGSPITILVRFKLVTVREGTGFSAIANKLNQLLAAYELGKAKRLQYYEKLAEQNRMTKGLRQFSLGILSEQLSNEHALKSLEGIIKVTGENPFETVFKLYDSARGKAGRMLYNPETRWNLDVIELVARCPEEIRYACDVPVPNNVDASVISGFNPEVTYFFKSLRMTCPYCGRLTIVNAKYCTFCFLMINLKHKEEMIRITDAVKQTSWRYIIGHHAMTLEEFMHAVLSRGTQIVVKESAHPKVYKKLPALFWDPRYAIAMCYRILGLAHAVGTKDETGITLLLLSVYEQRLSLFTSYLIPWFLCFPMSTQEGVVSFVGPADMDLVMSKFLSVVTMLEKYDVRDYVYRPKNILNEEDMMGNAPIQKNEGYLDRSDPMEIGYDHRIEYESVSFIKFIKDEGLTLQLVVQFLAIINGQLNALLINDLGENGVNVGTFASMETAILTNANMKSILKRSISKRTIGYSKVLVEETIPLTMQLGAFLQASNPVLMDLFMAKARCRGFSTYTITYGSIEVLSIDASFGSFSVQTSVGSSHMLFTPAGLIALETEGEYRISTGYTIVRAVNNTLDCTIGCLDVLTRTLYIGETQSKKFVFAYANLETTNESSIRRFISDTVSLMRNLEQKKHPNLLKSILLALYSLSVPIWQIWIRSHLGRVVPVFTDDLLENKLLMYLKWVQDTWKGTEYGFVATVRATAESFNVTSNSPTADDFSAASVSNLFWYFYTSFISGIGYFIGLATQEIRDITVELEPYLGKLGVPSQLKCNVSVLENQFGAWEAHELDLPTGMLDTLSSIAT